jgi:2-oxoglutarate ferredoxin oxidoreductase subunit alpha
MQCPTIMLSDQAAGQSRAVIDKPAELAFVGQRLRAEGNLENYNRYAVTANGISPMAVPGTPGGTYTADGLEHSPKGTPSTQAKHHQEQLDKRLRKLTDFNYGDHWAEVAGAEDAEIAVITFGSVTEQVREALDRAAAQGIKAKMISARLLFPTQPAKMAALLKGVTKALVVEQNHMAQFSNLLKSHYDLPPVVKNLNRAGPLALRPHEIVSALAELA